MRVDYPRTNLDDPGAGLRGRGWRVLTLADLRTPGGDPDPREPERDIELHLTGNMERFIWSLDGIKLNDPGRFISGRTSGCASPSSTTR
jgi:FtsP/CotA-like multicopper oxidase with cupredoxin domain